MSSRFVWPIALFWSLGVAGGFILLLNRSFKAGESGPTPHVWPNGFSLRLSSSAKTLVMFAHSKCPCSVASLTELENALDQTSTRPSIFVAFYEPAGGDASWRDTAIVRQAAKIPGAQVVWDRDGRIAEAFGANTSGHVVLYDSTGELKFSGGVTVMRGHLGPCQGQRSLVMAQQGNAPQANVDAVLTYEVYGCRIQDEKPRYAEGPLKAGAP